MVEDGPCVDAVVGTGPVRLDGVVCLSVRTLVTFGSCRFDKAISLPLEKVEAALVVLEEERFVEILSSGADEVEAFPDRVRRSFRAAISGGPVMAVMFVNRNLGPNRVRCREDWGVCLG